MKLLYELNAEMKKFGICKLAKLSGFSANTLYNWTSGKSVPTLLNAEKVARAMGFDYVLTKKS